MTQNKNIQLYYVDENVVRIIAGLVSITTIITLLLSSWQLALILTIDFATRAFSTLPSVLAAFAKVIAKSLKLKPKPIFAAPKKFAAMLGAIFSSLILILLSTHFFLAALIVGVLLLLCAVLESVFKICLGCYIYNWIIAP